MSVAAGTLEKLHRIHKQLNDLRGRINRGPKLIAIAQGNAAGAQKQFAEEKEAAQKLQRYSNEKQLQLKEREARIEKLQVQKNSCSSNVEYQTLTEQIAAERQANNVLQDEILELMDKVDQQNIQIQTVEENCQKSDAEVNAISQKVEAEQKILEADLEGVLKNLTKAENELPDDFKIEYLRVVQGKKENALAPVESDCCGVCYQTLTSQVINDLFVNKPVFCRSCGSLLYLVEGFQIHK
ncbi:MAG: phospholipase [Pirellulaceae bacterium]|nr:phospholipase [Pirellulaceae bacterium]